MTPEEAWSDYVRQVRTFPLAERLSALRDIPHAVERALHTENYQQAKAKVARLRTLEKAIEESMKP